MNEADFFIAPVSGSVTPFKAEKDVSIIFFFDLYFQFQ
jgi:hypothetical protein